MTHGREHRFRHESMHARPRPDQERAVAGRYVPPTNGQVPSYGIDRPAHFSLRPRRPLLSGTRVGAPGYFGAHGSVAVPGGHLAPPLRQTCAPAEARYRPSCRGPDRTRAGRRRHAFAPSHRAGRRPAPIRRLASSSGSRGAGSPGPLFASPRQLAAAVVAAEGLASLIPRVSAARDARHARPPADRCSAVSPWTAVPRRPDHSPKVPSNPCSAASWARRWFPG